MSLNEGTKEHDLNLDEAMLKVGVNIAGSPSSLRSLVGYLPNDPSIIARNKHAPRCVANASR